VLPFESSGLVYLHGGAHSGKEPTVIVMTTHPTAFQRDDVFDHALHRLHRLASLPAKSAVLGLIEDMNHLLTFHGMVMVFPRGRQQGHPSLARRLSQQLLLSGFPIHNHRRAHASHMSRFQP
jgi:hypothetical protein